MTGIPNFDHFEAVLENDFPAEVTVPPARTPLRETFRYDNRIGFLKQVRRVVGDKSMIFKLHPLEKQARTIREIRKYFPDAEIYIDGNIDKMIANAAVVITQQSTCTFTAVALGKETYSYLNLAELKQFMPIQNNGASAERIARICKNVLHTPLPVLKAIRQGFRSRPRWEQDR